MSVNICPAAVVAAPVESVWEILSDTNLYEEWWEARAERIVPEGKAVPGQVIDLSPSGLGRKWKITLWAAVFPLENAAGRRRKTRRQAC